MRSRRLEYWHTKDSEEAAAKLRELGEYLPLVDGCKPGWRPSMEPREWPFDPDVCTELREQWITKNRFMFRCLAGFEWHAIDDVRCRLRLVAGDLTNDNELSLTA